MRRAAVGVVVAAVALAALPVGSVLGVAGVSLTTAGNLIVVVNAGGGEGDDHGLVVEPYFPVPFDSRTGFRVAQDAFGSPTIEQAGGDCGRNVFVNDVVCNGAQSTASVATRGGDDRVVIRDLQTSVGAAGCADFGGFQDNVATPIRAELQLGEGRDTFSVNSAADCPPGFGRNAFRWSADADGGPGDDTLSGGSQGDTLRGGPGLDTLNGGAGVDDLLGGDDRDILEGAQDDDTFRGGTGNDAFRGGGGDDLMNGGTDGAGSDTFDGGPGADTVTYASASGGGVSVTIETTNNNPDGEPGEGDAVFDNVENVTGSNRRDTIVGDGDANVLDGALGPDQVTGAAGADTLLGNGGDDTIDARDGAPDARIDCGAGAGDVADIDLVNRPLFAGVRGIGNIFVLSRGCEVRNVFAIDDGPPGRLTSAVLRIGPGGVATARLACPRNARVACRGVLRLRTAERRPRIRATARYDVARGTTEAIEIAVPASLRGRTLQAATVERGVSRKGPRSSVASVRIR